MEAIQKISETPLKDCPECEQETLRKLVSAAAFKLTGTGWYETDFKDKQPKNKDSNKKEDNKSSNDKDNDKSEATKETSAKEKSSTKSETKADKPKKKESATD